jgi:hypothetical protein
MAKNGYDLQKIRDAYDKARTRAQAERYSYERQWFQNCLSGNTLIPLLDGSTRPMHSLVDSDPVWIYGFDMESLRVVPALMEKVWQTAVKDCIEIFLDNGKSFVCTSDHLILTWFGYVQAGQLKEGTPLVPYRNKYYRSAEGEGYNQIFQPYDAQWQQTHRMVSSSIYGQTPDKHVIHHINEIKTDNRPENLEPMSSRYHSAMTLEKYRDRCIEAGREWHRRPENRLATGERASKQWKEQREKMLACNRAFRSNPEYLEKLRASVKAFWADPDKKAKRIEEMKAYWEKRREAVNCRVIGTAPAGTMPVFDASVPATNNFALDSGVFAHNCLYFLGIQWIIYSPQMRKWRPRKVAKWVPRPVTNKFASIANTIMQVLSSKEPDVRATPGSDSPEDIAAAGVADRNFDVILKEMNSDEARIIAGAWLTLTGSVVLHPCYDKDPKHGTTFVQHLQCQTCGETFPPDQAGPPAPTLPAPPTAANPPNSQMATDLGGVGGTNGAATPMPMPLGAPPVLPPEQPEQSENTCPKCGSPSVSDAVDENGEPKGEDLPNGKMKLEVFSPFEVMIDLEARSMDDVQELLIRRRYPVEVIKDLYDKPELEADNNSNTGGAIGLNLLRAIAYAAGNAMYGTGIASGRNVGDDQNITVDMHWKRPCRDFPEGLVSIWANDQLLNDKEVTDGIPYRDSEGKPLWPWVIVQFDKVPGRIFGRTPMDDVAPKQEQRNKLESLIQLIITRCANPVWLVPKNLGVTEITGEPGQILEGNWAMDPRLKPERVPGDNVPTSIIAWLEKIDQDMNELAGTMDVLRGNAPPGVTAGTALRLLLERANTRFTPVINRLEIAWEKVYTDALMIFQQFATEERINKYQGPGKTWEVERFSKADLNGSIDVKVEAGSGVPKSVVGQQAMIQDLATMKIIDPTNPQTQYKILEEFGSTNLLGDTDENIKYAQRENWKFTNEDKDPVINPILDNHMVHLMIHKDYALSSDFDDLDPMKKQAFMQHIMDHMMAIAPPPMPQGAPGAGPGGPVPPGGGGPPTPNPGTMSPGSPNGGSPPASQQEPPIPGGPM